MAKKKKKFKHTYGYRKQTKKVSGPQGVLSQQITLQQALALHQTGRLPQAEVLYRQLLSVNPNHLDALHLLGVLTHQVGKSEIAIELISKALTLKPDYAEAHYNLGKVLCEQGKLDEAVASYRQALTLKPDYAEALYNLGKSLKDQGKLDEAVASYRQALSLKPDHTGAHNNLGNVLKDQGKLDEAVASYRQALTLKPDYAEAHNNLGNVLKDQGKLDEAVASYRQALTLKPYYAEAHSNLLLTLNYKGSITQKTIYDESINWYEQHGNLLLKQDLIYKNNKDINRKLRIGYVSPDFRKHSVAYFFEPLLKVHNRENVEVFCYSNVKVEDQVTKRLRAEADHLFSIVGKSNEEVAAQIREDRIDILVDLAGHTSENRLLVFAYKPSPIQVTWLGYPNTTGMRTMDYRLTDAIADPPSEADTFYSEKLFRLNHGFLCYQPEASTPVVGSLPCRERGYITFGSFNNLTKTTPEVIKAWANILHAVPDSRLLLKAKQLRDNQTRERFKELIALEGIKQERLDMHSMLSKTSDHLRLYNRVDIGLDPFPYNGTTTTCEALWMGVPVITMLGDRHAARVGASIMCRVGLEDLVAHSVDEYIALAVSLANDRHRLLTLRNSLCQMMQKSQLMDKKLFAETVENAYRQMWRKWCAGIN
jgi:predicted O-linked N-acetylglucosamine transferase (SPINDLY family)